MNKDEYIKKWSEKLGTSEADINKDFNKLLEEEKTIHKDSPAEEQETRALQRLAMTFKKQLRSPAVGFEGIVIGMGDLIDTVAKQKREAVARFEENPQKAIEDGLTNDEGVPLDTRQEWSAGNPNRDFGKPLPEHNWLRTTFGVAIKIGKDDEPKTFIMNMRGEVAKNEGVQLFKPVKFRAIDKSEEGSDSYRLNASTFTNFEEDDTLDMPQPLDLLKKYCSDLFVGLPGLDDYHDKEKDNWNRLVILEGDVSTLIMEPSSIGSRRIIVEDEKLMLEDLESQGTTCWVPPRINIDFGEQSKILVIGRTSQGKKLDTDGNQTDEPGDIMINVFGLYALPEYKISPNVQEITAETSEVKEESEGASEIKSDGGW